MEAHIDPKVLKEITAFFDAHPTLFLFFADPDSDTIIAAHNRRQIAKRIVNREHEPLGEVRDALNFKVGKRARGQMAMKFASMIHNIARDIADQGTQSLLSKKGRKLSSKNK